MKKEDQKLSVAVFGLGYVGFMTSACLARDGHRVTGIDISEVKVKAILEGNSPLKEYGLEELISLGMQTKRLQVSQDIAFTISSSDISIICVGTPSTPTDGVNLEYVKRVCQQIGEALGKRKPGHVVVLRSTVPPGKNLIVPTLEKYSNKKEGNDFFVALNPEFMSKGSAIQDYLHPPVIIIGAESDQAIEVLKKMYANLKAPVVITVPEVAEMVKYVNNAWHALKITFANEIGEICRHCQVDSHKVMEIFMQDRQLNISTAYLRPGFAFGGSRLPKDLRAIMHFARHHDLDLPVLNKIMTSNLLQIERVTQRLLQTGAKKIGLYGLSFKPHTDDLRESPYVMLAEKLIGKGIKLKIYNEFIQIGKLTGANREYIDQHLPHLVELLVDGFHDFDDFAEVVVIGHKSPQATEWVRKRSHHIKILDLARLDNMEGVLNYEGIYW